MMQDPQRVSFLMAFIAGVLMFLSPCVLPLIPAYISYLTGVSFGELSGEISDERRKKVKIITAFHSLAFIAGFSFVFVLLGAGATFLGRSLFQYQPIFKKIGGAFIIFFALFIMGVVKLPFLEREKKIPYKKEGVSFLGSIIVGATFAAAWTPCVGPLLGSILIYASSAESLKMGIKLLTVFSLGLGLPFFLSALVINTFLSYLKKIEKYLRWIKIATGIILIAFGALLLIGGRI